MSAPWIAAVVCLWVVVLLLALVVLGVVRRVGEVLERAEARLASLPGSAGFGGVAVGSVVPAFALYDEDGRRLWSEEWVDEPTILLFVEEGCVSCRQLVAGLDGVGQYIDGIPFAIVLDESQRAAFVVPDGVRVLYEREREASRALENVSTPQAYVLDLGGLVLDKRVPGSLLDLRQMAWFQREGGEPPDAHTDGSVENTEKERS